MIGRSKVKEDAKCSSTLTVSKHACVPQMETEDRVLMQRPGQRNTFGSTLMPKSSCMCAKKV